MATIPDNQKKLRLLAQELEDPDRTLSLADIAWYIRFITKDLSRRPYIRLAPAQAKPMTPALRLQLRDAALADPTETYQSISERFGVTAGRVSEAVAGKRK